jgi:alkanesulfonate monooxygenase SsuD/methylene tetrahydromethanopterin reductase-like flavin-dependent oxidoreductase (luciferase family)
MMPSVNVIGGAVLAQAIRKGRIVFLGNVLSIHDNPLRVAEEVAMIDILSSGRVVCGWPPTRTAYHRGTGSMRPTT